MAVLYDLPSRSRRGPSWRCPGPQRAPTKVAPSAPHALHMPSHIFTRLGMWKESIEFESRLGADCADLGPQDAGRSKPRSMPCTPWTPGVCVLQTGQDAKARELVDNVAKVTASTSFQFAAGYALPPSRPVMRSSVAPGRKLRPDGTGDVPLGEVSYAKAIVHSPAQLAGPVRATWKPPARTWRRWPGSRPRFKARRGSTGRPGRDPAAAAAAWVARARRRTPSGGAHAIGGRPGRPTDKHPVTPGSILPAREQLADLLAELGQPAAPLAE